MKKSKKKKKNNKKDSLNLIQKNIKKKLNSTNSMITKV